MFYICNMFIILYTQYDFIKKYVDKQIDDTTYKDLSNNENGDGDVI